MINIFDFYEKIQLKKIFGKKTRKFIFYVKNQKRPHINKIVPQKREKNNCLQRLSKSHLVGQNAVFVLVIISQQPVHPFNLVLV